MSLFHVAGSTHPSWRVGVGGLCLGVSFFITATSSAIPAPMPVQDRIFLESTEFASGSVIVGRLECFTEFCAPELLIVSDGLGAEVSGQLVDVSGTLGPGYFGWLPDVPPSPGSYWIDLRSSTLVGVVSFTIVEANTALPSASVALHESSTVTGERVECLSIATTAIEQGFYESALHQVSAIGVVSGSTANQYIYDVRLFGDEENRFVGRSLSRVAEGEPSEVCVEVFARPIVGGDDVSLIRDCYSTEGLTLGVVDEISAGMPSALRLCTVPPEGYFDEWCAAFAEEFAAESCFATHPEACFAARGQCPEGDHPTDEEVDEELSGTGGAPSGTGGTGSGGGTGGAADGTGNAPGDGDAMGDGDSAGTKGDRSSSEAGGCSLSPTRGRGGSTLGLLIGCVLFHSALLHFARRRFAARRFVARP